MKNFRAALVAVLFLFSTAANALIVIKNDPGGYVEQYKIKYETIRAAHDQIKIDGPCYSACTQIASIIEPHNVCVTDNAKLGFHSAFYMLPDGTTQYAEAATMEMFESLPVKLQRMLRAKGFWGQEHPDLVVIEGEELRSIYMKCDADLWTRLKHSFGFRS